MRSRRALLAALMLLVGFALALEGLTRDSLWADEAFTLWAVRDDARPPQGVSATARYLAASLGGALARACADVHPPLYFLLMDAWTLTLGESVLAARLPSALALLLGASAACALGGRLFGQRAGLLAAALLLTAPLAVYYAREARMYALLLALAACSTLAYAAWRERPTRRRGLAWGLLAALLLYTHYAGALVVAAQAAHALLTRGGARALTPLALTGALFAPWLPALIGQIQTHGGPAAQPVDTVSGAAALWLALTAGAWPLVALALAFSLAAGANRRRGAGLIALWLLLTPAALLALNAAGWPVFQLRYTIAIVPAWALLLAASLTSQFPLRWKQGAWREVVRAGLALALIAVQLAAYDTLWPPKPRWAEAARQVAAVRDPLEPALVGFDPWSPASYYNRLHRFAAGLALDIGWRWHEPDEARAHADRLAAVPRVWLLAHSRRADAWDALAALLAQGRGVGYRDTVMDTVFYRLDQAGGAPPRWRFGDLLDYTGGIGHQLDARAGEPFCFTLRLVYRTAPPANAALRLALTQGYDTVRAAATLPLPSGAAGDAVTLPACIDVPAGNPSGPHHLRAQALVGGAPLPLLEDGSLYWGETLFIALVSVS